MIRSKNYIKRNIGTQTVIVAVGEAAKHFHGMISVNNTGSFIWDLLEKEITLDALVAAMTAVYNIDSSTAKADINDFLINLKEVGAVEGI